MHQLNYTLGLNQASGGSITFALSNQGQVWGGDLLGINCNINYYTTNLFNNSQAIVSVHNTLPQFWDGIHFTTSREAVSYTHLRAHKTVLVLVCRPLLEKNNKTKATSACT